MISTVPASLPKFVPRNSYAVRSCIFVYLHARTVFLDCGTNFGRLAETKKVPIVFFLRFIPSACGRPLSNLDHAEELGLAVLGKDALLTVPKLEH